MTRKDFEAIANTINKLEPNADGAIGWFEIVDRFADMCAAHNPRFARDKFVEACNKGV